MRCLRENVEIVHRMQDAIRRRDLDAYVALHDPECEISLLIASIEGGGTYRGHEGVRTFWSHVDASFAEWRRELEEVRDLGNVMILKGRFRGRGTESGVTIDRRFWHVIKFRGGRAASWAAYATEEEALEVALRE